ncbi:hypothetical protein LSTR_LSTR006791 [Laodelphax striatellus]|uniref:Ion transport domain-containing protein n=1 Tax=Laodelphax striatellus TaxID=195883 RepID=A0A482WSN2_LAOST|nr:hypothetical protein LSTR_LSTR006791 [Laodelphax striatellus]
MERYQYLSHVSPCPTEEIMLRRINNGVEIMLNDDSGSNNKFKHLTEYISRKKQDERFNYELLTTAAQGRIDKLMSILGDNTTDFNAKCRLNGATPLILATARHHEDVAIELVKHGADITIRDYKNRTVVHFAAANGYLDLLMIIFQVDGIQEKLSSIMNSPITSMKGDRKVESFDSWNHEHKWDHKLNVKTRHFGEYTTPLHLASYNLRSSCVKFLLDNGADPRRKDRRGLTALDVVGGSWNEYPQAILENRKENLINIVDSEGRTPLFLAMEAKWLEGIEYFLRNGCNLTSSHDNSNVFHVAARLDYPEILLNFLQIDNGIEELLNLRNKDDETPLSLAVRKPSATCVKHLLRAGAILSFKNREGMTPLHVACRNGLLNCVKLLVEYGSDVKAVTGWLGDSNEGDTSLHLAARYGHQGVVEYLLQKNKSLLNTPNNYNWYPLHVAIRYGMVDCVQSLIAHGADFSVEMVDLQTGRKQTALDLMVDYIPQPKTCLQHLLDSSINMNMFSSNHPFCMIKCKRNILIPQSNKPQLATLVSLINNKDKKSTLKEIISHPVIEVFLFNKWQKLRVFFMSIIMLFTSFTVSFTALTLTTFPKKYNAHQQNITSSTVLEFVWSNLYFKLSSDVAVGFYRIYVVGSLIIIGLFEICQAVSLSKNYLFKIESWLRATIIILTVWTLLFGSNSNSQTKSSIHAIIILFSWFEILFLVACLPNWDYSVLMFRKVARDVMKVLMTFSCLIFGFTYTFMVLFQLSEPFATFAQSLLKIVAMMAEYDYGGTFIGKQGQVLARSIFISFIILVSIVMMNLMIGIAVSDIAELEHHGRVTRRKKQIEFLYLLESIMYFIPSLVLPEKFKRALGNMWTAPTELIFRPGTRKPLCSLDAPIPPDLLRLITDRAVEFRKLTENKLYCLEWR